MPEDLSELPLIDGELVGEPAVVRPARPRLLTSARTPGHPLCARLVLIAILTTQLMVVLDATIVNVALPNIQHDLGFSVAALSWVINAYVLAFGGLLLLGARSGDLLGRRRTFLAGLGLFVLSSLLGGFATAQWMLLASRALQGVGGAFAAPATLALLASVYPEGRERVRALGLFTAVSVGGAALGLVIGGALINLASWRWVFFVNVPIGAVVLLLASVVLTETPRATGRFDVLGALSSTLGVGGLVYGFVSAASHGWAKVETIAAFVAGVLLLGAFVRTEKRASQPILPLRLLANRTRSGANAARALTFGATYGIFFYLTQFLQNVRHFSPLETGIAFLPIPVSVFSFSQLTTRVLMARFRPKPLMLVGLGLTTAGIAACTLVSATTGYPQLAVSFVLVGAGNGISFVTLTQASLTDVAPVDAGAASGLVNVSQQIGPALGVSIQVTVFSAATAHLVAGQSAAQLFAHGVDHVFVAATLLLVGAGAVVLSAIPGRKLTAPAR